MIHACYPVCQEFKGRHGYIASWKSAWHAYDPASIKINKEKTQTAISGGMSNEEDGHSASGSSSCTWGEDEDLYINMYSSGTGAHQTNT